MNDLFSKSCSADDDSPAAHPSYVAAERNKRSKALWGETAVARSSRAFLLEKVLLSETTIQQYHFGLAFCRSINPQTSKELLCLPVPDERGPEFAPRLAAEKPGAKRRGQYVLFSIPELSGNYQEHQIKRGATLTMYATPKQGSKLVVCTRILDAIYLAQTLTVLCKNEFTIIASTDSNEVPLEWRSADFWRLWDQVYFAFCDSTEPSLSSTNHLHGRAFSKIANRTVFHVRLPARTDWTQVGDVLASRNPKVSILDRFQSAEELSYEVTQDSLCIPEPPRLEDFEEGEYGDLTHDISYNYVGLHYYYPFSVLRFSLGTNQQRQISRLTRLLRHDGRILGWSRVPSVNGGSDVIAADDGTLLSRAPEVSASATWALENILSYARVAKSGTKISRSLGAILADMRTIFTQSIWLPYPEQLYLLLFTIPVTYVQELFSAVPYLLIQGPKGSGKSELAHILSWLCSNSTIVGSGSHAFAAAQIDQARGLVVLDDRETLVADDLDRDLLEILKIGYKRATGTRGIVGPNRKLVRQHVYGVKAITCVSGVEEIVGTRMIRIRTAPYPRTQRPQPIRRFQAADQEAAQKLRQEMHQWAFENIEQIRTEYENLTHTGSRWDEITAPLRTIAALCGDSEFASRLEQSLAVQLIDDSRDTSIETLLNKSIEAIIRAGFTREVSVTQVRNELALQLSGFGRTAPELVYSEMPAEAWITRTLRAEGWLKKGGASRRARVQRKALLRIWELEPTRVSATLQSKTVPEALEPTAFCIRCSECQYRHNCSINPQLKVVR